MLPAEVVRHGDHLPRHLVDLDLLADVGEHPLDGLHGDAVLAEVVGGAHAAVELVPKTRFRM